MMTTLSNMWHIMKEKHELSVTNLFSNYWQIMSSYLSNAINVQTTDEKIAPGVQKINLGLRNLLVGNLYAINPNPYHAVKQTDFAYDIAPLLNELDQQSDGRSAYNLFNMLTDDMHLLADTSPEGRSLRGAVIYYLNDLERIEQIAREIVKESIQGNVERLEISSEQLVRTIVLKILMNVFFDSKELPEEIDETMKLFSKVAFTSPMALLPKLSFFDSECCMAKKQYRKFCHNFINTQAFLIYELFQAEDFTPKDRGSNLFIDLIVLKVKERYVSLSKDEKRLTSYLKNLDEQEIMHYLESMKAIPSIFMLADNISLILTTCLDELRSVRSHSMRVFKDRMQSECREKFSNRAGSDLTRRELRELEQLDKFYRQALSNCLKTNMISRYSKNPITLRNKNTGQEVTIPAKATVLFSLGEAATNEDVKEKNSSIFSVQGHKRKCPGSRVTESIFKIVIGEILTQKPASMPNDRSKKCSIS